MDTMEENGELVFLYQLIDGVTDNSHALYTAMLAGIPQEILDRVTQVVYYSMHLLFQLPYRENVESLSHLYLVGFIL